jgi:hypothetical protein
MLYQHDHQPVTQPLLLEQLRACGVDIASGQLARLLSEGHEGFPAETDAVLRAGLEGPSCLNVDDTSARHQGQNGYCLYLGRQYFAGSRSRLTQDRLSFITVRWNSSPAPHDRVDAVAVDYLRARGASPWLLDRFTYPSVTHLRPDDAAWEAYLKARLIVEAEEVRRVAPGWLEETVILSEGAGQFAILCHALCWVQAERALRRLVPPGPLQRQAQERVLDAGWEHYRALKAYPQAAQAARLSAAFDALCLPATGYHALNQALKRRHQKKAERLRVLERPDLPLHHNAAEEGWRDRVQKRTVSAGPSSESGRACRDPFASLKKTCLKLKLPFLE